MNKFELFKQSNNEACGPACIFMAAKALGVNASLKDIEKVSKYKSKGGLSNQDLIDTLQTLGFHTKERTNATWQQLSKEVSRKGGAVIVSWMLHGYIGHFSIVKSVSGTHITLADPAEGKLVKMEKVKFLRLWMDYDDMWYPKRNTDIQLRWFVAIRVKPNL